MLILPMAPLLSDEKPTLGFQARDQVVDFDWHVITIVQREAGVRDLQSEGKLRLGLLSH